MTRQGQNRVKSLVISYVQLVQLGAIRVEKLQGKPATCNLEKGWGCIDIPPAKLQVANCRSVTFSDNATRNSSCNSVRASSGALW